MIELSVGLNRMFYDLSQNGPMEYRDNHPKRDTIDLIERVGTEKHLKKKIRRITEKFPHAWPIHEQAAYVLRAFSGLQLFPDANHRTGLAIMRAHLNHFGYRFDLEGEELKTFIDKIRNPKSTYCCRCNAGQLLDRDPSLGFIAYTIQNNMKRRPFYLRILERSGSHLFKRKIPKPLLLTSYEDSEEESKRKDFVDRV